MKKHLLILCFLLGFFKVDAFAYDFEVDDCRYNLISTKELTCELVGVNADFKRLSGSFVPATVTYANRELKVISIGEKAFAGCTKLETMQIGKNIKRIGKSAFAGCSKLRLFEEIPDSIEYIGPYAFSGTALLKIYTGPCIKTIEEGTYYSTNVGYYGSVVIPDGIESIGDDAFAYCHELDTVKIEGESLKSIGSGIFRECENMRWINIPNSVNSIAYRAFSDNSFTINIPDLRSWLMSPTDLSCLSLMRSWNLQINDEEVTKLEIPVGIDSIKSYAFSKCNIKKLYIPNTVTGIGKYAFDGCKKLGGTITIPSSVKFIDNSAFSIVTDTVQFKRLIVEDSDEPLRCNCSFSTDSVYIGRDIDGLGIQDFKYAETSPYITSLPSAIFKSTLKTLIVNYTVGNTPLTLDSKYTSKCTNLLYLRLAGVEVIPENAFANSTELTTVVLGNSVKVIGSQAFSGLSKIEYLTIGNSVERIDSAAFRGSSCYGIILPNTLKSIGAEAFKGTAGTICRYLYIPNSVKSIGAAAFSGAGIRSINLGDSVEYIGPDAFYNNPCSHLTIPSSVKFIGKNAFGSLSWGLNLAIKDRMDDLDLSDTKLYSARIDTLYLGMNNFNGINLEYLEHITLASNITSIPNFKDCKELRSIVSLASTPPTSESVPFSDIQYFGVDVYVPEGSLDKYMADDNWDDFFYLSEINSEYFTLEQNILAMAVGSERTIDVYGKTSNESIVWSSSDPNIAIVDNGKVVALHKGTVTITAQLGNTVRTCVVTVQDYLKYEWYKYPNEVIINENDMKLVAGATKMLTTTVYPLHFADATRTWSSSNEAVAIVDANGVVTAVAPGAAIITVKCGNFMDVCKVNVIPPYVLGDVTGDEQIAVDDVVYTISYVIGIADDDFNDLAADMNSDGLVLIDDVVLIIDAALGIDNVYTQNARDYAGKQKIRTENAEASEVDVVAESDNRSIVGVALDNKEKYVAMQFDMCLSDGITMNDIKLAGCSDHAVVFNELEDGVVRVLVTSLSNECFAKDNKLNIDIVAEEEGTVSFTNAYAVTAQRAMSSLANIDVNITRGTTNIKTNSETIVPSNIYDLKGRLVKENATSTDGLKKGIYLMNGKKILVK